MYYSYYQNIFQTNPKGRTIKNGPYNFVYVEDVSSIKILLKK